MNGGFKRLALVFALIFCACASFAMSRNDAMKDLYFGIRVSIDGVEVCSTNIYYTLRDQYATENPQNINNMDWTANVAANGVSATLTISTYYPEYESFAIGRIIRVSSSTAVRVKCYVSLNQLVTYNFTTQDSDSYGVSIDGRESAAGDATVGTNVSIDALPTLNAMWKNLDNPNKYNFGSIVRVEIRTYSPTYLPLRDPATGLLMRGALQILRDE